MTNGTNPGNVLLPGDAWAERAEDLACWTWTRLVNRTDAYGGYRPPEKWGKEFRRRDGTIGKLGPTTTHKRPVTPAVLVRHFRARGRADVIGLHTSSLLGTCLWGAVDIDWHGPTSTAAAVNSWAALAWYDQLVGKGFHPLLLDSNGKGGYHLWILLSRPVASARMFHFLQQLIGNHRKHGMEAAPETFPKQAMLRPDRDGKPGFGNWLRVPGRHHTRDHWALVWGGTHWLAGRQAVGFLLGLEGDPPELVPQAPPRPAVAPRPRFFSLTGRPDAVQGRIAAYMDCLPNLGEGQGRDDVAYRFAARLVRDWGLSEADALDWLRRWDAGNRPPKGEERLREIITNALRYGKQTRGAG